MLERAIGPDPPARRPRTMKVVRIANSSGYWGDDPKRGYAYDFIGHLRRALPEIARRGIRIVVNAGGVNTEACREAIMELCRAGGVSIPIAIVDGGDLMPRID